MNTHIHLQAPAQTLTDSHTNIIKHMNVKIRRKGRITVNVGQIQHTNIRHTEPSEMQMRKIHLFQEGNIIT